MLTLLMRIQAQKSQQEHKNPLEKLNCRIQWRQGLTAKQSQPTLTLNVGGVSMPSLWPYPYHTPHTVVGGHFRSTRWLRLDPKKVFACVEFLALVWFLCRTRGEASHHKNTAETSICCYKVRKRGQRYTFTYMKKWRAGKLGTNSPPVK